MSDKIFALVVLSALNVGLWFLIFNKRAQRHVVKGLIRGGDAGSRLKKEDIRSGEVAVFCMAIVGAIALGLVTAAAFYQALTK